MGISNMNNGDNWFKRALKKPRKNTFRERHVISMDVFSFFTLDGRKILVRIPEFLPIKSKDHNGMFQFQNPKTNQVAHSNHFGIDRDEEDPADSMEDPTCHCETLHRTPRSSLDILEYLPGEFDLRPADDLTAWVLSGSAELDLPDGSVLFLHPGKAFFLPRGMSCHWMVREPLRTAVVRGI
jgi:uncharacterized cupin superfamily protein